MAVMPLGLLPSVFLRPFGDAIPSRLPFDRWLQRFGASRNLPLRCGLVHSGFLNSDFLNSGSTIRSGLPTRLRRAA
jgi:hypothetical protein